MQHHDVNNPDLKGMEPKQDQNAADQTNLECYVQHQWQV